MLTSSLDTDQLRKLIEKKMHNSYIEKYVHIPQIDDNKLKLVTLLLKETAKSVPEYNSNIVSAMLVQLALDTHDLVPSTNTREKTASDMKTKQLSVLAGDYYSGLYYLLLAETEDIEMVHILAGAIKEINEYKMQLYYLEKGSPSEFLKLVKNIESLLFVRVAAYADAAVISEVVAEWLLLNKLKKERTHLTGKGVSAFFSVWSEKLSIEDADDFLHIMDNSIDKTIKSLTTLLDNIPQEHNTVRKLIEETLE
ncbi:heptaprenyl diphosphate synthase component 1 [Virgibacillus kekensis]|uniref:Heptaprenyl diphosphate synthase component 1 n=1 Tax=Virgibacillus kekensis TaxID=202261 RepID=A0ABV9DHV9_9BACI